MLHDAHEHGIDDAALQRGRLGAEKMEHDEIRERHFADQFVAQVAATYPDVIYVAGAQPGDGVLLFVHAVSLYLPLNEGTVRFETKAVPAE